MTRKYLVAGNWKMNGSLKANAELLSGIAAKTGEVAGVELLVCPTAVHLESVGKLLPAGVVLGAQNLSEQTKAGAFTGEILGSMLTELGVRYVLVGHSNAARCTARATCAWRRNSRLPRLKTWFRCSASARRSKSANPTRPKAC